MDKIDHDQTPRISALRLVRLAYARRRSVWLSRGLALEVLIEPTPPPLNECMT